MAGCPASNSYEEPVIYVVNSGVRFLVEGGNRCWETGVRHQEFSVISKLCFEEL
jgi:hypothetical protein